MYVKEVDSHTTCYSNLLQVTRKSIFLAPSRGFNPTTTMKTDCTSPILSTNLVKQNATVLKNQGNNKGLIRKWRSTSLTISYSHAHKSYSHSDDSSDHT